MFCWRITKYNPHYRSTTGAYERNEWTSFSDIGKTFDNKKLTPDDYLRTEDAYIATIIAFMECAKVSTMRVTCLEKHALSQDNSLYSKEMLNTFNIIAKGMTVDKEAIKNSGRLALREDIWCKLEAKNMYVHFGYDYYLYIGTISACDDAIMRSEQSGLFLEPYNSPYSK